jgi:hypothetical protein
LSAPDHDGPVSSFPHFTLKAAFLNSAIEFPGQVALHAVFFVFLLSFGHCQTPLPAIVLFALISQ